MSLNINIYYTGENGSARKFAEEMVKSGIVDAIREEEGNEGYSYYFSMEDPETVLLIDSWKNQAALDLHHGLPLMKQIMELREKYDLHMKVKRYKTDEEEIKDEKFIRK